jgi:hypothetical protein
VRKRAAAAKPPRPRGPSGRASAALLLLLAGSGAGAAAPEPPPGDGEDEATSVVVASRRYRAGGFHRSLLGRDYRDLWALPVRVEVLDLARFGGGLTPVRRVGAGQSSGLALSGGDGRAYTFRALEKDATRGLSPELRRTIAARVAQDQVAAMHPAATVVASPLLEAAGVLHVEPRLVVMPDDARLGAFRADFAGVLGTIQEYPRAGTSTPGFAGASEIVDGEDLLARLRAAPGEPVDAQAFLRARLMDLFLGDWDRHLGQWRFARLPSDRGWQPLPEDRDFAFCRFEGLALGIMRNRYPRWVTFGDEYPDMLGLTWQAWPLDRVILSGLERPAWDEVAADLVRRLTDDAIDEAVRRMPSEYRAIDGARLVRTLRSRRDRLPEAAARFYRHLAEEVRIEGTDGADVAEVRAEEGGALEVSVSRAARSGEPAGAPWFHRRFRPEETREVRLELHGGDDRFVARGRTSILVRVAGGPGDDVLDDAAAGQARLADAEGRNVVRRGPGTLLDTRRFVPPPLESAKPWLPARDWGRQTYYLPWFGASPEVGLFLGAGVRRERFAFRTYPLRSRNVLRVGYAIGANGFRADYEGAFHRTNSRPYLTVNALASQIEILRFFGYGNETENRGEEFHQIRQTKLALAPAFVVPLASRLALSLGVSAERFTTRRPAGRFITDARPYGSQPFGQLGARAGLRFDTRDEPGNPARGVVLDAGGTFHPAGWDVRSAFGDVHGEAAGYVTARIPLRPTFAARIVARRVLGDYPFHEAAFVGGGSSVRGYSIQRFAGDAAAFGNAEARLLLGTLDLVLPAEVGVFALADAGRVWLDGEDSDRWHGSVGGGLWLAYLSRAHTVTAAAARGAEGTGFYLRMGFLF